MFLFGIITGIIIGILLSLIGIQICFFVFKIILNKQGKEINKKLNSLNSFIKDSTLDNAEIIYPENVKEMFDKLDSSLEDLIKE